MNPLVLQAAERVEAHERRNERMAALRQMEREYLAVRQMSPRDAALFLDSRGERAAARLQSSWRGARVRRSIALLRGAFAEQRQVAAAAEIQRAERRRRRVAAQVADLRSKRDETRAGLVLELPLIQKRILDEVADFRLYEPKSAAEAAGEAARALADWAELRRRSSLKTNQRQRAHTEARALLEGLQRAHDWSDCAHESLAHLRPLGRHGIEARPSAEHVRLHRALTRMAELDADEAIAARGAADARAR
ncbi:hypothetical protein T492DRAFT_867433, partial [Pavlovales sp. CCMP2436]